LNLFNTESDETEKNLSGGHKQQEQQQQQQQRILYPIYWLLKIIVTVSIVTVLIYFLPDLKKLFSDSGDDDEQSVEVKEDGGSSTCLSITGVVNWGFMMGVEVYVICNQTDLSKYVLQVNYEGPSIQEIPLEGTGNAGDFRMITNHRDAFQSYFGFPPHFVTQDIYHLDGKQTISLHKNNFVVAVSFLLKMPFYLKLPVKTPPY